MLMYLQQPPHLNKTWETLYKRLLRLLGMDLTKTLLLERVNRQPILTLIDTWMRSRAHRLMNLPRSWGVLLMSFWQHPLRELQMLFKASWTRSSPTFHC